MADNLPTSLTVLRPIGFGTIRGPDGTDVNVMPNMADDHAIRIHTDEGKAAKMPKTPAHGDFKAPDDFDDDPDVQAIDIGVHGHSSDEDDAITAFSAEELAGRVKANRRGAGDGEQAERYEQRVHGRERDAERKEHALDPLEDEVKFTGGDRQITPVSSSRHILLDPSNMPNTTIAPMSKMKMETFQEVKATLKWKVRGLQVFAACIGIMGVVCVAIGAVAIETAFLYTAFPYVTIAGGVVMLAAAAVFAWTSKSYKPTLLQAAYLVSGGLGAYMAISGIVAATRPSTDITGEVQKNWFYGSTRTAADDANKYSADFQDRWNNDPQELIDAAERHLRDLSIVELISGAFLFLNMFLLVRISHILQKHLTLTDLATKSKSESNTKQALRQKEVEAYKAAVMADPDNHMALDMEEERIPSNVKVKLAAKAKKYAATTGTEMAEVKKKKKAGGATGSGDVVPENKKKKHTAAERKEKKARKKARKEAERARQSQANNGELGPNVAQDDSGSSDSEDEEAVNEAKFKNVVANL